MESESWLVVSFVSDPRRRRLVGRGMVFITGWTEFEMHKQCENLLSGLYPLYISNEKKGANANLSRNRINVVRQEFETK